MNDAQTIETPRPGRRTTVEPLELIGMVLVLAGGLAWLVGAGAGLIFVSAYLADFPWLPGRHGEAASAFGPEWTVDVLVWGLIGGTAVGWLGFALIGSTMGRKKSADLRA